jgi:hypothetical protein
MGLAAVTEANSGDITVKLKVKRSQPIDDVMSDLRAEIKSKEPELDIEFTQVLQDMINDLSNSPEPIQIKLFNNDPALLAQVGDEVATAIKKQTGVVDVLNGVENTSAVPPPRFASIPPSPRASASPARRSPPMPAPLLRGYRSKTLSSRMDVRTPSASASPTIIAPRSTPFRTPS